VSIEAVNRLKAENDSLKADNVKIRTELAEIRRLLGTNKP
jgi:hypothetical protein